MAVSLTISITIEIPFEKGRSAHLGEWIPVLFSIIASLLMLWTLFIKSGVNRLIGLGVGYSSVGVGIGGLLFHLDSQFFAELTIKSLVYTAPFIAPLLLTDLALPGMLGIFNLACKGQTVTEPQ